MKGCFAKVWLLSFLAVAACPAFASSRTQRGAELFNASGCRHCHSIGHVGGKKGPDLSNIGRTAKKAAIRKQILKGGNGMPAFEQILQPPEIKDLVAYLHSCRQKPVK